MDPTELITKTDESESARIEAKLRRLERRDWWFWSVSVVVTLLLTAAVIVLAVQVFSKELDPEFRSNLSQAVRGLVALVLIFNIYTVYQQWLVRGLRRRLYNEQTQIAELQKLALIDPLTGLYNRRIAEQRLPEEIARSHRSGSPFTLVSIDLNDFKQINDQYGHFAGDLVLKELAKRLRQAIRFSDIAVRMGGDEFMLLLPDCRPDQVHFILDRLTPLPVTLPQEEIVATFAMGWACLQSGETPRQLLERADQALYANKGIQKRNSAAIPREAALS